MFRSYLSVIALVCLAGAVGCSDDTTNGTGGSGGSGDGGSGGSGDGGSGGSGDGGTGGSNPEAETLTVGCSNSVTPDVSMLEWELHVSPTGPVTAGAEFTAEVDGTAFFAKAFLDVGLGLFPGLTRASLTSLQVTVIPRSGATGDPVALGPPDLDTECSVTGDPCTVDTDCAGAMFGEFCASWVNLPTSNFCDSVAFPEEGDGTCDNACDEGGLCEQIDPINGPNQCTANDFCVLGDLPLPLTASTGTYTAEAEGPVLYGWDDENTGATIADDGTYELPAADPSGPVPPNGIAINIPSTGAPVPLAIECTGAIDSNQARCSSGDDAGELCLTSNDEDDGSTRDCQPVSTDNTCDVTGAGVGVEDLSSPTPDDQLFAVPFTE